MIWRFPFFAETQPGELCRQGDPFIDELAKETIVFQLLLDLVDVFLTDKLAGALAVPGKTDLVIRAVFDWGSGFAAAIGAATDVVLL